MFTKHSCCLYTREIRWQQSAPKSDAQPATRNNNNEPTYLDHFYGTLLLFYYSSVFLIISVSFPENPPLCSPCALSSSHVKPLRSRREQPDRIYIQEVMFFYPLPGLHLLRLIIQKSHCEIDLHGFTGASVQDDWLGAVTFRSWLVAWQPSWPRQGKFF